LIAVVNLLLSRTLEDVKGRAVRALFRLPLGVLRALAGRPVVIDGKTLDPEMQLILKLQNLEGPDFAALPIGRGRRALVAGARMVGGSPPVGSVSDRAVAGPEGELMLRFYTPRDVTATSPALLYIHGGGFVYGDLDNYDAVCRFLAERAGVRVVAIDYRLAPEHGFPAAVDDVLAAYRWVVEHAEGLGIDPERVAVGGDSAGGNLAAVVAQQTVGSDAAPVFQLLIYPLTDMAEVWPSRKSFADGFFFSTLFRDVIDTHYAASAPDRWDPRISPLYGDVTGVAPAYLVTAGFDPLLDEGKAYADKLADAGVQVEYVCEEGLIHSFANMVSLGRSGPEAMARAAEALRRGLAR